MMKIIQLSSSNFKRIKAVEVKVNDDQNLIIISGENGQGKSSLIDSIYAALSGGKDLPEKPIHDGEESAEINVELAGISSKGDPLHFKVKRTFTDKASYLTVTTIDGHKFTNPQEFLDTIVGRLSFDPLAFIRMPAKAQVSTLCEAIGLDLSQEDEWIKESTANRLLLGREIKQMATHTPAEIEEAKKTIEETKELPSSNDLSVALANATVEHQKYTDAMKRKTIVEQEIQKLTEELEGLNALKKPESDIAALTDQLKSLDEKNNRHHAAVTLIAESEKYAEKKKAYDALTNQIDDCNQRKSDAIAKVVMPIPGLSWNEDSILYGGIPFSQVSDSEKLSISVAIAIKLNPNLRIILVKDGGLLDKKSLKAMEDMATKENMQIWLEKVDDSGKLGIVIEEGEVKSINS
jgi:hypothetical protein